MSGWNRKLGTSKRAQGIATPKKNKFFKCGCVFEYDANSEYYFMKKKCIKHVDTHAPINYDLFLEFIRSKKRVEIKKDEN